MNFPKKHSNTTVQTKGWGLETLVHNNEKYCIKLLDVEKGKECSLHYHKYKEESFLVLSGSLQIIFEYGGKTEIVVFYFGAGSGGRLAVTLRRRRQKIPLDLFFSTLAMRVQSRHLHRPWRSTLMVVFFLLLLLLAGTPLHRVCRTPPVPTCSILVS